MKNHTLIELTKQVENLHGQMAVLRDSLAANTQSTGKNTIATEGITTGLKELASETGGWRSDDKEHHESEDDKDQKKIDKMDALNTTVSELVDSIKALVEFLKKE